MLQCSPAFAKLVEGHNPAVNYEINDHHYTKEYYLDGHIYPKWLTLVNTIYTPLGKKVLDLPKKKERVPLEGC